MMPRFWHRIFKPRWPGCIEQQQSKITPGHEGTVEMNFDPVETCVVNGNSRSRCKSVCKDVTLNTTVAGDAMDKLDCLPDASVDLVFTSPPYSDKRKTSYGGVPADQYNEWFIPITKKINRVLKPTGSFVLNIKDEVGKDGTRHPYVYELVTSMAKDGWKWMDTFIWSKSRIVPRIVRYRFKDGFEYIYHFTKQIDYKRDMKAVMVPMKESSFKRIASAKRKGDHDQRHYTVSGLNYKLSNLDNLNGMSYPSNVITASPASNKTMHTAVMPRKLPEFFIDFLTKPGDVVLDPFVGSGTTAIVAKEKCRNYVGIDKKPEYVDIASKRLGETGGCTT